MPSKPSILNTDTLLSEAAILTGGTDQRGGPIITLPAKRHGTGITDLSTLEMTQLLNFWMGLPRMEQRHRGYTIIIDLSASPYEYINFTLDALDNIKAYTGLIHVVYLIKPRSRANQKCLSKALSRYKQSKFKQPLPIKILNEVHDLKSQIDSSQLTSDLGGYLVHDHQACVRYLQIILPFIQQCEDTNSKAPRIIAELEAMKENELPSTLDGAEEVFKKYRTEFARILKEINIKSLLNDGTAILKRLHRSEVDPGLSTFATKPIYQDLAEDADKGYTKIVNANKKITSIWNDIETQLRQCFDLRNFQSRVDEIMNWLKYRGESYLETPIVVATSLSMAQQLRHDFQTEFYVTAKNVIDKAEKLQQEAEDMIGYKHYDTKNIGYFSEQFHSVIKKFSGRLDTRRKILNAVFSFYYLLTRLVGWYEKAISLIPPALLSADLKRINKSDFDVLPFDASFPSFIQSSPPPSPDQLKFFIACSDYLQDAILKHDVVVLINKLQSIRELIELYSKYTSGIPTSVLQKNPAYFDVKFDYVTYQNDDSASIARDLRNIDQRSRSVLSDRSSIDNLVNKPLSPRQRQHMEFQKQMMENSNSRMYSPTSDINPEDSMSNIFDSTQSSPSQLDNHYPILQNGMDYNSPSPPPIYNQPNQFNHNNQYHDAVDNITEYPSFTEDHEQHFNQQHSDRQRFTSNSNLNQRSIPNSGDRQKIPPASSSPLRQSNDANENSIMRSQHNVINHVSTIDNVIPKADITESADTDDLMLKYIRQRHEVEDQKQHLQDEQIKQLQHRLSRLRKDRENGNSLASKVYNRKSTRSPNNKSNVSWFDHNIADLTDKKRYYSSTKDEFKLPDRHSSEDEFSTLFVANHDDNPISELKAINSALNTIKDYRIDTEQLLNPSAQDNTTTNSSIDVISPKAAEEWGWQNVNDQMVYRPLPIGRIKNGPNSTTANSNLKGSPTPTVSSSKSIRSLRDQKISQAGSPLSQVSSKQHSSSSSNHRSPQETKRPKFMSNSAQSDDESQSLSPTIELPSEVREKMKQKGIIDIFDDFDDKDNDQAISPPADMSNHGHKRKHHNKLKQGKKLTASDSNIRKHRSSGKGLKIYNNLRQSSQRFRQRIVGHSPPKKNLEYVSTPDLLQRHSPSYSSVRFGNVDKMSKFDTSSMQSNRLIYQQLPYTGLSLRHASSTASLPIMGGIPPRYNGSIMNRSMAKVTEQQIMREQNNRLKTLQHQADAQNLKQLQHNNQQKLCYELRRKLESELYQKREQLKQQREKRLMQERALVFRETEILKNAVHESRTIPVSQDRSPPSTNQKSVPQRASSPRNQSTSNVQTQLHQQPSKGVIIRTTSQSSPPSTQQRTNNATRDKMGLASSATASPQLASSSQFKATPTDLAIASRYGKFSNIKVNPDHIAELKSVVSDRTSQLAVRKPIVKMPKHDSHSSYTENTQYPYQGSTQTPYNRPLSPDHAYSGTLDDRMNRSRNNVSHQPTSQLDTSDERLYFEANLRKIDANPNDNFNNVPMEEPVKDKAVATSSKNLNPPKDGNTSSENIQDKSIEIPQVEISRAANDDHHVNKDHDHVDNQEADTTSHDIAKPSEQKNTEEISIQIVENEIVTTTATTINAVCATVSSQIITPEELTSTVHVVQNASLTTAVATNDSTINSTHATTTSFSTISSNISSPSMGANAQMFDSQQHVSPTASSNLSSPVGRAIAGQEIFTQFSPQNMMYSNFAEQGMIPNAQYRAIYPHHFNSPEFLGYGGGYPAYTSPMNVIGQHPNYVTYMPGMPPTNFYPSPGQNPMYINPAFPQYFPGQMQYSGYPLMMPNSSQHPGLNTTAIPSTNWHPRNISAEQLRSDQLQQAGILSSKSNESSHEGGISTDIKSTTELTSNQAKSNQDLVQGQLMQINDQSGNTKESVSSFGSIELSAVALLPNSNTQNDGNTDISIENINTSLPVSNIQETTAEVKRNVKENYQVDENAENATVDNIASSSLNEIHITEVQQNITGETLSLTDKQIANENESSNSSLSKSTPVEVADQQLDSPSIDVHNSTPETAKQSDHENKDQSEQHLTGKEGESQSVAEESSSNNTVEINSLAQASTEVTDDAIQSNDIEPADESSDQEIIEIPKANKPKGRSRRSAVDESEEAAALLSQELENRLMAMDEQENIGDSGQGENATDPSSHQQESVNNTQINAIESVANAESTPQSDTNAEVESSSDKLKENQASNEEISTDNAALQDSSTDKTDNSHTLHAENVNKEVITIKKSDTVEAESKSISDQVTLNPENISSEYEDQNTVMNNSKNDNAVIKVADSQQNTTTTSESKEVVNNSKESISADPAQNEMETDIKRATNGSEELVMETATKNAREVDQKVQTGTDTDASDGAASSASQRSLSGTASGNESSSEDNGHKPFYSDNNIKPESASENSKSRSSSSEGSNNSQAQSETATIEDVNDRTSQESAKLAKSNDNETITADERAAKSTTAETLENLSSANQDTTKTDDQPISETVVETSDEASNRSKLSLDLDDHVKCSPLQSPSSETFDDFKTPIVIDNGSSSIKAGLATESNPSVIFPSIVGRPQFKQLTNDGGALYYGDAAQEKRDVLTLSHPVEHGVVKDWDDMELLWQHMFEDQLRLEANEHPVLITEAPMNPKKNRETITQIMFENFNVPYLYVATEALLSLYESGRTTGLVFDSGDGVSYSVPIYEGCVLDYAVQRLNLAGQDLTQFLARALNDRGSSFTTDADMETVREIKENLCFVTLDYDTLSVDEESVETSYTLPDGQVIKIGNERFRCPEVLFSPAMVGLDLAGIHKSISSCITSCDVDIRKELMQNVVLAGGNSQFKGLPERLKEEIEFETPSMCGKIRIHSPCSRINTIWRGGAILASSPKFCRMCITSAEYEEFGPSIVNRRCL